ncbi:MAG: type II toxin-antitoxin system HicB family antitoxin [Pirellulales bacterium]
MNFKPLFGWHYSELARRCRSIGRGLTASSVLEATALRIKMDSRRDLSHPSANSVFLVCGEPRAAIKGAFMRTFRIPLRVVFYKEEGRWVAHCLEFDVCGDGRSKEAALECLDESMKLQIEDSLAHNNPRNLFSPAPSDIWEKFFAGTDVTVGALRFVAKPADHLTFEHFEYREYADDDMLALPG